MLLTRNECPGRYRKDRGDLTTHSSRLAKREVERGRECHRRLKTVTMDRMSSRTSPIAHSVRIPGEKKRRRTDHDDEKVLDDKIADFEWVAVRFDPKDVSNDLDDLQISCSFSKTRFNRDPGGYCKGDAASHGTTHTAQNDQPLKCPRQLALEEPERMGRSYDHEESCTERA